MKYLFMLFFVVSTILAAKDYPVMLQIKSDLNIPDDLRTGIEEGLTENNFSLISEEVQKEALKEQAHQRQKECYDESCLVDTGKMLAARGLVIVEIVKKNEKYYLFKAKYIDFESGTTQKTKSDYFEYDLNDFKELNKFGKNLIINTMVKKENKEEIIENNINENPTEPVKTKEDKSMNLSQNKFFNNNSVIDESTVFVGEVNFEFYTSYKYLDFKNLNTNNIFTIGFYIHYLYARFYNFSISVFGAGGGYSNDDYFEASVHIAEMKYIINNIELNLSLLGFLGRLTFTGDEKNTITQLGYVKIGYFYQTDNFAIRPFVNFGIGQFKEKDGPYSSDFFGGDLGYIYGMGISIDFDGKKSLLLKQK